MKKPGFLPQASDLWPNSDIANDLGFLDSNTHPFRNLYKCFFANHFFPFREQIGFWCVSCGNVWGYELEGCDVLVLGFHRKG